MAEDRKWTGVLGKVIAAIVVALLVGGTAPWWWGMLFPETDKASVTAYEITIIGQPRFEFLNSGVGVGPPYWVEGRYAFLADVRVANEGSTQLVVRNIGVTLSNPAGVFAAGEENFSSLDNWQVEAGQTVVNELQLRTDIFQEPERFPTRFEEVEGAPKPRFEFTLRGSVSFEIVDASGELETKAIAIDRIDVLIQPLGQ